MESFSQDAIICIPLQEIITFLNLPTNFSLVGSTFPTTSCFPTIALLVWWTTQDSLMFFAWWILISRIIQLGSLCSLFNYISPLLGITCCPWLEFNWMITFKGKYLNTLSYLKIFSILSCSSNFTHWIPYPNPSIWKYNEIVLKGRWLLKYIIACL